MAKGTRPDPTRPFRPNDTSHKSLSFHHSNPTDTLGCPCTQRSEYVCEYMLVPHVRTLVAPQQHLKTTPIRCYCSHLSMLSLSVALWLMASTLLICFGLRIVVVEWRPVRVCEFFEWVVVVVGQDLKMCSVCTFESKLLLKNKLKHLADTRLWTYLRLWVCVF